MSFSIHMDMRLVYQNELEPLNDDYPHPIEFHGETYLNTREAFEAWNDELLYEYEIEEPDWRAELDVNRVKFQDPEMRKVLLSASYKELHVWTDFGRVLMTIRDELVLEEADSIDEALDAVVPSREMREYMKAGNFDRRKLPNLIAGAPIPLEEKVRLLDRYGLMLAVEGHRALDALVLEPGEVFVTKDCWRGEEGHQHNRLFTSFDAAMGYVKWKFSLRGDDEHKDEDWKSSAWTVLEKWVPGKDGRMNLDRSYTLFGEDIVYFVVYDPVEERYAWRRDDSDNGPSFTDSLHLTLDKPFKAGDCITLDCQPVAAARDALVLEVIPAAIQTGSILACLVQEEDKWMVTPEWRMGKYASWLSPLYRMAPAEPDETMQAVQKFIGGDAGKAQKLRKELDRQKAKLSTEELMALLEKLEQE